MDRIDQIRQDGYQPSDQDILRSRKRTTELQKIEFKVRVPSKYGGGQQDFWMFDVGGQRGERRKWIQVFNGISAILFLVESSGFDTKIREDNKTNRLQESLEIFEQAWSSRFLRDVGFIIFLNKQDILKEKIENGSRVEDHFPEYKDYHINSKDDNEDEYHKARCFIQDKFVSITKKAGMSRRGTPQFMEPSLVIEPTGTRECFTHFTTATDTENIKRVFNDVHTMVIMSNLKKVCVFWVFFNKPQIKLNLWLQ